MSDGTSSDSGGRQRVAAVVYNPIKVDLPAIEAVVAAAEEGAC